MQSNSNINLKAYLALGVGALSIASSPVILRLAKAPGPVTSFYRMAIGSLIFTIPFLRRMGRSKGLPRKSVIFALTAGLFFFLDLSGWSTGVMLAGATIPTLMANTAPIWVGFGAMIFLKEKLETQFWLGLALAIVGSVLILGIESTGSDNLLLGALLGLGAAIFYGSYFLMTQKVRETLDALSAFWLSSVSSTFFLLIGVKFIFNQSLTGYSTQTYFYFLFMGLVTQSIGWYAISYALGQLPASLVAPTLLLQPALAGVIAGPVLGERFSSNQLVGGLIVLAGIFVIHYSRKEHP